MLTGVHRSVLNKGHVSAKKSENQGQGSNGQPAGAGKGVGERTPEKTRMCQELLPAI